MTTSGASLAEDEREESAPPPSPVPLGHRVTWQKLTFLPAFLLAVLLATWLWFERADLDPLSRHALSNGQVSKALWQHVRLTVISTFFVLVIAIPLGIVLTRGAFRRASPVVTAVPATISRKRASPWRSVRPNVSSS